jgi:hypothetical protein
VVTIVSWNLITLSQIAAQLKLKSQWYSGMLS